MQLVTRECPDNFNLFLMGDFHIGSLLFFEKGLRHAISLMNKPYARIRHNITVLHGDLIEAIAVDDKRFDLAMIDPDASVPDAQADKAIKLLKPIADRIVVSLMGNHEDKLGKYGNISARIARELGCPYGTYTSRITYTNKSGKTLFKHYATHGRKGINNWADDPVRRIANMKTRLKRDMMNMTGDCILSSKGHTHKCLITEPIQSLYLADNGKQITQHYTESDPNAQFIHPDHRWYVNTGSLMRLYRLGHSGYAEKAEYPPIELAFPVVRVRRGKIVGIDKVKL